MNFIIFLVRIFFAQNPRNSLQSDANNGTDTAIDWSDTSYTDYENYQRWLSQQFNESLKIYPERLDLKLKTRVRFTLMGLLVSKASLEPGKDYAC